jgi:hypothetical protein
MLEALALNAQLLRTWQHIGRRAGQDIDTLARAYIHSKNRCSKAIQGSMGKSFGVWEKHRVRKDLLDELDAEINRLGLAGIILPVRNHRPFYIHPTSMVLQWFRWNMNKLCAGFEMVHSLRDRHMILWDHTRIMLLFLRCLRLAYGGGGNQLRRSF